jgi:hypothetical protein
MDRTAFLVALDAFARKVAVLLPGARIGLSASVNDADWCVYVNGPPLFLGHGPADLPTAERDLAQATTTRALLVAGPYCYDGRGARAGQALPVAGGPVGVA